MPPPNITGQLHMGHALFLTIQDSLNRFYRNLGHNSLWLPGLDHAGLATHEKIIKHQKKKNKSYQEASLEIEKKHREIILSQIKELGSLPDWRYLTYTLDEEYQDFTKKTLKLLLEKGRIKYKDGDYFLNLEDYALKLWKDIKNDSIEIIPSHEKKDLKPFLTKLQEWNISRQIPWGTKIPLIEKDGKIEYQEDASEDSLDTWFNSSLWCIATLQKYPELRDKFYPATLIETGADILFFWCARMLMMSSFIFDHQKELGIELNIRYCFSKIYLHGIIRDKEGQKFSKSLGNGIDPLKMIEKYGADATRLFIITRSGPAEDIIFDEKELSSFKKFQNKIFQSARFFSIYAEKADIEKINITKSAPENLELKKLQIEFCRLMDGYNFLEASRLIQSQFKQFFCDQWIEDNKEKIQNLDSQTIKEGILILDQMLSMINPFMPYISYHIKKEFFDIE